jgi:hypothetical protein
LVDERELKELLRRADIEAEQCKTRITPRAPRYNDSLQKMIQAKVNRTFEEYGKQAAAPTGKSSASSSLQTRGKRRLEDISDEDFIRGLTQPTALNLDERPDSTGSTRRLADISDEDFIKSITEPVVLDL